MSTLAIALILCGSLFAQDMASCPMHDKSTHQADFETHGDAAMGFPHDKATHHFRLAVDGGAIEVTVNDSKDTDDLQAIREHLKHIAVMFSNGDFSAPMFVHSEIPPGVSEMKNRKTDIIYTFEETPIGGKVRIATANRDALNAVHDFLIISDSRPSDRGHRTPLILFRRASVETHSTGRCFLPDRAHQRCDRQHIAHHRPDDDCGRD
jgi:hypothetical protein